MIIMTLYTNYSGPFMTLSILLPIIVCAFHYFTVGAKGVILDANSNSIQRFSILERIYHFLRMLSFIIVAFTGIYLVFRAGGKTLGMTHSINGIIFLLVSILSLFIWSKPSLFKGYDKLWLKSLGGYLSADEIPLPAGKFNAGQKIFFWLSTLFAVILAVSGGILIRGFITQTQVSGSILVIHGITAALTIISVMGHVYLSLWVNKGTWRVLTGGKVSEAWAKCHHPNWEINNQSQEA